MRRVKNLVFILFVFSTVCSAETVTDPQLGYHITLPDNWSREIVSPTHHRFIDTTRTYPSIVAIDRTDFQASVFAKPDEWTRANFIAYTLTIQADAFSALIFYDTVSVRQNDSIWAADAYSVFFDTGDTLGDWAEYIRYTAVGTFGYELYVIGLQEDLDSNITFYTSLLNDIVLTYSSQAIFSRRPAVSAHLSLSRETDRTFNLLGKNIGTRNRRRCASQVIVAPQYRRFFVR